MYHTSLICIAFIINSVTHFCCCDRPKQHSAVQYDPNSSELDASISSHTVCGHGNSTLERSVSLINLSGITQQNNSYTKLRKCYTSIFCKMPVCVCDLLALCNVL